MVHGRSEEDPVAERRVVNPGKLYGNPDGPTFEFLVERGHKLGLKDDQIFEAIIDESFSTNVGVDKRFDRQ